MSSRPTRILIADDHAIVRQGLDALFRDDPDYQVCRLCTDGDEAALAILGLCPEVALLDHSMPKQSGLEVLERLANAGVATRVIMLSSFGSGILIAEGLRRGAHAWLLKEDAFDEVRLAIAAVIRGEPYFSSGIDLVELREAQQSTPITAREMEVLRALSNGLSAKEVAAAMELSPRTVETYRARLMAKLSARNSVDLFQKARLSGLLESRP